MKSDSLQLPTRLRRRFKTHFTEIAVEGKKFKFLEIDNLDTVLGEIVSPPKNSEMGRPFWVKIWESAIILAYHLARMPVASERKILEIGAGMGVSGIVAAYFGHDVAVTDINEDALAFARVNAAANGMPDLPVFSLDWNSAPAEEKWDMIIGADVVYRESGFHDLVAFLRTHLAPNGVIYLSLSGFIKGQAFFEEMAHFFVLQKKTLVMRSEDETIPINLFSLRFREDLQ